MTNNDDVDYYGEAYDNFASQLYEGIRREIYDEDLGQTSWLTAEELDMFISWLALDSESRLLNVGCGSGGPTLHIVRETGCSAVGIDIDQQAIAEARAQSQTEGLQDRVTFEQMDASEPLPFSDESFDGLICIDAITHLPDRARVFDDWFRVLKPGGRLVFPESIAVTGALSDEEMRIRSSLGPYLFVPEGFNEDLLAETGFEVQAIEDRTENIAQVADRWVSAREARETDLREVEGDETFEGTQAMLRVSARLAEERRLSGFAFCAHANK